MIHLEMVVIDSFKVDLNWLYVFSFQFNYTKIGM